MVVFFFVRTDDFLLRLVTRIVLVPVIAGISYEVIRWAGNSNSKLVALISYPGLCLQKITTAEPDPDQIETAIAAMKGVLEDEPEEDCQPVAANRKRNAGGGRERKSPHGCGTAAGKSHRHE